MVMMGFFALAAFPNVQGTLRALAVGSLCIGWVLSTGAFLANPRSSSGLVEKIQRTSGGVTALRIAAVVLWLAVLPMVLLWVYQSFYAQ